MITVEKKRRGLLINATWTGSKKSDPQDLLFPQTGSFVKRLIQNATSLRSQFWLGVLELYVECCTDHTRFARENDSAISLDHRIVMFIQGVIGVKIQ